MAARREAASMCSAWMSVCKRRVKCLRPTVKHAIDRTEDITRTRAQTQYTHTTHNTHTQHTHTHISSSPKTHTRINLVVARTNLTVITVFGRPGFKTESFKTQCLKVQDHEDQHQSWRVSRPRPKPVLKGPRPRRSTPRVRVSRPRPRPVLKGPRPPRSTPRARQDAGYLARNTSAVK